MSELTEKFQQKFLKKLKGALDSFNAADESYRNANTAIKESLKLKVFPKIFDKEFTKKNISLLQKERAYVDNSIFEISNTYDGEIISVKTKSDNIVQEFMEALLNLSAGINDEVLEKVKQVKEEIARLNEETTKIFDTNISYFLNQISSSEEIIDNEFKNAYKTHFENIKGYFDSANGTIKAMDESHTQLIESIQATIEQAMNGGLDELHQQVDDLVKFFEETIGKYQSDFSTAHERLQTLFQGNLSEFKTQVQELYEKVMNENQGYKKVLQDQNILHLEQLQLALFEEITEFLSSLTESSSKEMQELFENIKQKFTDTVTLMQTEIKTYEEESYKIFHDLKGSQEGAFKELRSGLDKLIDEFHEDISKLISSFKEDFNTTLATNEKEHEESVEKATTDILTDFREKNQIFEMIQSQFLDFLDVINGKVVQADDRLYTIEDKGVYNIVNDSTFRKEVKNARAATALLSKQMENLKIQMQVFSKKWKEDFHRKVKSSTTVELQRAHVDFQSDLKMLSANFENDLIKYQEAFQTKLTALKTSPKFFELINKHQKALEGATEKLYEKMSILSSSFNETMDKSLRELETGTLEVMKASRDHHQETRDSFKDDVEAVFAQNLENVQQYVTSLVVEKKVLPVEVPSKLKIFLNFQGILTKNIEEFQIKLNQEFEQLAQLTPAIQAFPEIIESQFDEMNSNLNVFTTESKKETSSRIVQLTKDLIEKVEEHHPSFEAKISTATQEITNKIDEVSTKSKELVTENESNSSLTYNSTSEESTQFLDEAKSSVKTFKQTFSDSFTNLRQITSDKVSETSNALQEAQSEFPTMVRTQYDDQLEKFRVEMQAYMNSYVESLTEQKTTFLNTLKERSRSLFDHFDTNVNDARLVELFLEEINGRLDESINGFLSNYSKTTKKIYNLFVKLSENEQSFIEFVNEATES